MQYERRKDRNLGQTFSIPLFSVYKGLSFGSFNLENQKNNERIRKEKWWERDHLQNIWEEEWWEREDIWERGAAESWRIEKYSFRVFFYSGFRCWLNWFSLVRFNRFNILKTKTELNWFFLRLFNQFIQFYFLIWFFQFNWFFDFFPYPYDGV